MNSFLAGFADELVKLGVARSSATGSPCFQEKTAAPDSPEPPYGKDYKPIKPQIIRSYAPTKKRTTWRPSPRYIPKPMPKPVEKPKKKWRGRRKENFAPPGTRRRRAGEGSMGFMARRIKERIQDSIERKKRMNKSFQKDPQNRLRATTDAATKRATKPKAGTITLNPRPKPYAMRPFGQLGAGKI